MSFLIFVTFLVSFLLLVWATFFWVPLVINTYGHMYFEWSSTWRPGFWQYSAALMLQVAFIAAATKGYSFAVTPFAAMMAVACQGLVHSDLRFMLIPDRFQLFGALGAVGYVLATSMTSYEGHGITLKPLLQNLASGPGLALLLMLITFAYERLSGREALGLGDIKMIAWLGLAFGPAIGAIMLYAIGLAALVMIPLAVWRLRLQQFVFRHLTFAFGPCIVGGVMSHLLIASR